MITMLIFGSTIPLMFVPALFQYFQIQNVMWIESLNEQMLSFSGFSFLSVNEDVPITSHSHSLNSCTDLCSLVHIHPGAFPIHIQRYFFCCCCLFCDRDTRAQLEFKSSPALGASDSVSQTFNRPASYINIKQECPNDIHRTIINFPVISIWHKLDLMKEQGVKQDLFN